MLNPIRAVIFPIQILTATEIFMASPSPFVPGLLINLFRLSSIHDLNKLNITHLLGLMAYNSIALELV